MSQAQMSVSADDWFLNKEKLQSEVLTTKLVIGKRDDGTKRKMNVSFVSLMVQYSWWISCGTSESFFVTIKNFVVFLMVKNYLTYEKYRDNSTGLQDSLTLPFDHF